MIDCSLLLGFINFFISIFHPYLTDRKDLITMIGLDVSRDALLTTYMIWASRFCKDLDLSNLKFR